MTIDQLVERIIHRARCSDPTDQRAVVWCHHDIKEWIGEFMEPIIVQTLQQGITAGRRPMQ